MQEITDQHVANALVAIALAVFGIAAALVILNWEKLVEAEKQRKRRRDYGQ